MHDHSSPRNPFRPVDWRWERARKVVEGELGLSRSRDDEWTRKAVKFRRRLAACSTGYDLAELSEATPDLYWAHRLYLQADLAEKEGMLRYEVEARILADEPPESICARSGLDPEDLEAFEAVFYDCRCKLGVDAYIRDVVIGPRVHRGVTSRDYDVLWKMAGYHRGVHVLQAMVSTYGTPRYAVAVADVARVMAEDHDFDVLRVASVAGKTYRLTTETQGVAIETHHRLREGNRRDGAGAVAEDALTGGVHFLLTNFPYQIGPPPAAAPDAGQDALPAPAEVDAGYSFPATSRREG